VLADGIYNLLGRTGGPAWVVSHGLASTAAIAILTYFHIVVGEMVPKSLALQKAERMALTVTPIMQTITTLIYPFVVILNGVGNRILKVFGIRRQAETPEQYYTPEELQLIVQESEELGAIRAESGQMLQELFEFGDLSAGEVMVPRVRIIGIPVGSTPEKVREVLGQTPHTRYPIHQGDLDHIVGMIHIKDLLRILLEGQPIMAHHARPLPLAPESAPLDAVLAMMRKERTQMAVVIDEHGGTSGIVTLEDLFEEVVGDIEEGTPKNKTMYRDREGRLRVPGTMRVDELGQQFDLDLEHKDVDSISGLVLTLLGRPPVVGDTVRYDRLQIEVTKVKGHGVEECAVSLAA
jgi:CBS domain containing-hemolysin-like protein